MSYPGALCLLLASSVVALQVQHQPATLTPQKTEGQETGFGVDLKKHFEDLKGVYKSLYGDGGNFGTYPVDLPPTPTPKPVELAPEEVINIKNTPTPTPTPIPDFEVFKLKYKECGTLNITEWANYDDQTRGDTPLPRQPKVKKLTPLRNIVANKFANPSGPRERFVPLSHFPYSPGGELPPLGIPGAILVKTTMTKPAKAGDTTLHVESSDGFEVGGSLKINPSMATEESIVLSGFGSLLLATPLQHAHAPGETIQQIVMIKVPTPEPATPTPTKAASSPSPKPRMSPVTSPSQAMSSPIPPTVNVLKEHKEHKESMES